MSKQQSFTITHQGIGSSKLIQNSSQDEIIEPAPSVTSVAEAREISIGTPESDP